MGTTMSNERTTYKLGPFLCEWCGTPLETLKGVLREDGKITGIGYCPKCRADLWSKPIEDAATHPMPSHRSRSSSSASS